MLRLGILGLGMVAAMVVFDCGGRTPLQDEELFGAPGSINTTGGSGTTSTGRGAGGTAVIGGAGNGFAGSTSTGASGSGVGGSPGFGGTSSGTAGSAVGTGGTPGFGGRAGGGNGGFGGTVGTGGSIGMGGAGGGPAQVRRLLDELPGTRTNTDCIGCASMCQGSAQCAANPACVAGLNCVVANCGMQNGDPNGACLAKCLGGDQQTFAQAIAALTCIYGTCGRSCTVGRMR